MGWYQSVCSGVLLILSISMAAVTNPSSVSLPCLLDPQTPPPHHTPPDPTPPTHPHPSLSATANKYTVKNERTPKCACADHPRVHPQPCNLPRLPFSGVQPEQITLLEHTHTHTHTDVQRSDTDADKCGDGLSLSPGEKKKTTKCSLKTTGDAIIPLKWPRLHRANVIRKLQR